MAYDGANGTESLIAILKEKAMNKMMEANPKFDTSPVYVNDKDYDFSIDPSLITIVETDPFHGYENKKVTYHLYKLKAISYLLI